MADKRKAESANSENTPVLRNSREAVGEVLRNILRVSIIKSPKDETKRILKKSNKIISEKVLSIPCMTEFFTALGYTPLDEERMKYTNENIPALASVLADVRAYKEKYEQVPEETLKCVVEAEEGEKKRQLELEKLEVTCVVLRVI